MQPSPTGPPPAPPDASSTPVRAIYVHVPFCARRCPYCDFAIDVTQPVRGSGPRERVPRARIDRYLRALAREIDLSPPVHRVRTLYFGGGTPSALPPDAFGDLVDALRRAFDLSRLAEFTLEANPEDLEPARLDAWLRGGVTRLSLGAQSFDARALKALGRRHRAGGIEESVTLARKHGLRHVSLDLIIGLPERFAATLDIELDHLLRLEPDHVSLYCLTFESGTAYTAARDRGVLAPLDPSIERDQYDLAVQRMDAAGLARYEVSNFARPGCRSLHNRVYWRNQPYLGLGPSAVSYVGGERWKNLPSLEEWWTRHEAGLDATMDRERLPPLASLRETVMVGLRTRHGVRDQQLRRRFGRGLDALDSEAVDRFQALGLVERTPHRLRLTRRGFEVADAIAADLL